MENTPIKLKVNANNGIYQNIAFEIQADVSPIPATSQPITKEKIIEQLSKTGNTQFEFTNINVNLGNNLYIPKFSIFNELRRQALAKLEQIVKSKYEKNLKNLPFKKCNNHTLCLNYHISILLNELSAHMNYSTLSSVAKVYIPLQYFLNRCFKNVIENLCQNQNIYIYLPTITRKNYANILHTKLNNIVQAFSIKGFVISNLSQVEIVKNYHLEIVANYTLNVYNNETVNELKNLGIQTYTISPELDKSTINEVNKCATISSEIICYGYLPLMNCNYCLLGKSNKCYPECNQQCKNNFYYLRDRMGFLFKVVPDKIETVTTIYNSKITSIAPQGLNCDFIRLDFTKETIEEINEIITTYQSGNRIEGQNYTSGNLNREV